MKTKMGLTAGAAATALVASCGLASATVQFSDSQFDTSVWVTETISSAGTFSATQSIGTGNGGPARHVDLTTGASTDDTVAIFNRYGNTTATRYEPMVSGAISSVDLQMDVKLFASSLAGQGPEVYLGIKQGNIVFRTAIGFEVLANAWSEILHIGYTASDFVRADGAPGSLDFSGAAAPIRFGFVTSQTNAGTSFTTASEYDNFCVYVQNVPSPGVLALMGTGALFGSHRRRRNIS